MRECDKRQPLSSTPETRSSQASFLAMASILACVMLGSTALAQVTVQTWNGQFNDSHNNTNYPFFMAGTDPSNQNQNGSPIPVYVVPLKVTFGNSSCTSGQHVFDPSTIVYNNESAVQMVVSSPIFTGITGFPTEPSGYAGQYIDAFQRGNFWYDVLNYNQNYHLNLQNPPTFVQEQNLGFPNLTDGAAANDTTGLYGQCIGVVNVFSFPSRIPSLIDSLYQQQLISPTGLVMFVMYDVFLGTYAPVVGWRAGGAGEHNSTLTSDGGALFTWLYATYNDATSCSNSSPCLFPDVDDFSHETAEWADDPFGNTQAPCNAGSSYLEVADPLLGYDTAAYHSYPAANGYTYHLQDLVYLSYFGKDLSKEYGQQLTFQGASYNPPLGYCSNGG